MNALLPQSLAEWRGREGVGLDRLARALRIEATTLERIEAGEVNPGTELRERIGRTIERGFDHSDARPRPGDTARSGTGDEPCEGATGSSPICYSCSSDEFPSAAGNSPPDARREGAATDGLVAAPVCFPAPCAWLAKRDDGWRVEFSTPVGRFESLSIDTARWLVTEIGGQLAIQDATRALAAKITLLVVAHDAGPDGFAQAFP